MVKVCGVAREEDAQYASSLGADIIGVVLDRSVARHGTAELVSRIHGRGIRVAGVYTSMEAIIGECGDEDLIQMHFPHSASDVARAHDETGRGIISVIQLNGQAQIAKEAREHYRSGAEIVLLEDRTGIARNLELVEGIQKQVRTGLAGRITPSDAPRIAACNPLMIDLSSSLESSPGVKDHRLINQLFRNLEAS